MFTKKNPNRITKTNKVYLDGKEVAEFQQGGIRFGRRYIFKFQELNKIMEMWFEKSKGDLIK